MRFLRKKKEILCKIIAERMEKIEKLHNSIDFKNLMYLYMGQTPNIYFNDFTETATAFD